jgi:transcriptional regulator with XRE-family HTH domain
MEKSTFTSDYRTLCRMLREARIGKEVTQAELAKRLKETQSEISKFERGERRLDMVQLRIWCRALGIGFVDFARKFDEASSGRKR